MPISKIPVVRSSRRTHNKRPCRGSGFVLVRSADLHPPKMLRDGRMTGSTKLRRSARLRSERQQRAGLSRAVSLRMRISATDRLLRWAQSRLAAPTHNPTGIWRHSYRVSRGNGLGACRTRFSLLGNSLHSSIRSKSPSFPKDPRLVFLVRRFDPERELPFFVRAISVKEGFG